MVSSKRMMIITWGSRGGQQPVTALAHICAVSPSLCP